MHLFDRGFSRWGLWVGLGLAVSGGTAVLLAQAVQRNTPAPSAAGGAVDEKRSAEAFRKMATVLRHPRCMNCHTATNFPRQGDSMRRHDIGVQRGPDDHGLVAMPCSSCHRDINQRNGVPGAPGWALAPLTQAWEGLDDAQLADLFKDTARNGHRSLEEIFEHMADAELVGWAWKPGGTRSVPPLTRAEFTQVVREWIDTGAVSPRSTPATPSPSSTPTSRP